jgi:hypothetical protein
MRPTNLVSNMIDKAITMDDSYKMPFKLSIRSIKYQIRAPILSIPRQKDTKMLEEIRFRMVVKDV